MKEMIKMKCIYLYSICCNWLLSIITSDTEVIKLIKMMFGSFVVTKRKICKANLEIHIMTSVNGYELYSGDKTYQIKSITELSFYLYRIIDKLAEANMNNKFCVFHGGALTKFDTTFAIIAPTTVGKSTFVTYFACKGYNYLSDDYIFLERECHSIYPFQMPVSLRRTDILNELLDEKYMQSGYNTLRGEDNTLVCIANENIASFYPLSHVIFINRGSDNHFHKMSNGELYSSLLFNLKNAQDLDKERISILRYTNEFTGYELTYNNLEFAFSVLESMVKT